MMNKRERRRLAMEEYRRNKKIARKAMKKLNEENRVAGIRTEKQESISNSKSPHKTIEDEMTAEEKAAIEYIKTIQGLLPGLLVILSKIKDLRNPKKTKHKVAVVLFTGILLFIFNKTSRREGNREMTTPRFIENLRLFIPGLESLPHQDTINRFLSMVEINEIEGLQIEFINRFIKQKKFAKYLINKSYPIAVDGSQKYSYDFLWAEGCQRRKKGNGMEYYVYTLEASLVFRNGMVIPIASEFLDYMEGDIESDKQDSEIKGFKRLAERLKGYFPRLKIMILLDGLYPNGEIFALCKRYGWGYMIVLQDKSLKSVWDEYNALKELEKENQLEQIWGGCRQKFIWVNDILYTYCNDKKEATVHMVTCEEKWDEVSSDGSIVVKQSRHVWLSSEPIGKRNVHERCNLGARYRLRNREWVSNRKEIWI